MNDAARLRADTWDASLHTLPEWQCRPHPSDYGTRGPADLRIWKDVDPLTQRVVAYHTHVQWQAQERTIWMDGRPHPPDYAPHTWQGFSTGRWDGDKLVVNAPNCVDCKATDVVGPRWTPREGGSGPAYRPM